jgi:hypothetical protein
MKWTWLNFRKCFYIVGMWCVLIISGCKKLVQIDEPIDSLTTSAVFSNDSLAQAAITGLYIKIMNSPKTILNGGMSLFPALSADELVRTSTSNFEDQFTNNSILSSNQFDNVYLWKAAYTYIYQCNICMEGLKKSIGVSATLKKQLLGEVQFIRALCYHYLVNLYGEVPLALGTNADVNAMLSRSPVEQVYQQITADLTDASEELSEDKPNTTPTKYAAQALLARVYLYTRQWSKAAEMASVVINSDRFSMVGDLNKVFTYDSKEIIFQSVPVQDKMNSAEGFMFVPPSQGVKPNYMLTKDLLSAFEIGDLRRTKWVNSVIGTTTYNYPNKFKLFSSPVPPQEYNVVLRLAEQYLIRAEARAQLNRIDSAVTDLNAIRSRAELPMLSTTISVDECLHRIEQERRMELFAEWGHRWFDLKRTNRANAVLSAKGSSWNAEDQLYPIPATELEFAPNLKQNPGYE